MLTQICKLSYDTAIDTIKDTKEVHFKSGVWNNYEVVNTEYVINRIKGSGYGADVFVDENNEYYVQCPSASDMW